MTHASSRSRSDRTWSTIVVWIGAILLVGWAGFRIAPAMLGSSAHGWGCDASHGLLYLRHRQAHYSRICEEESGTARFGTFDDLTGTTPGGLLDGETAVLSALLWRDHDGDSRKHRDHYVFELSLGWRPDDGGVVWDERPADAVEPLWMALAWLDLDPLLQSIAQHGEAASFALYTGAAPILLVGPDGDIRAKLAPHATLDGRPMMRTG